MSRAVIIGIVIFIIVLGLLAYIDYYKNLPALSETSVGGETASPSSKPPLLETRKIKAMLFFGAPGSPYLMPEEREITYDPALSELAANVIRELIAGPKEGYLPTVPEGTMLRHLFISQGGVAYVDFSDAMINNHPGGSEYELLTVYSIVNTLTLNFPSIQSVQLLINGQEVETLKGHISLEEPLKQDLSLALMREGAKATGT